MSNMKKQFRNTASSGRATFGTFGTFGASSAFETRTSPLAYVYEPPDLSLFTNNTTVIQVKNLMKKDATTKAKALEDLQAYLKSKDAQVEDALLATYSKLYPRLSIDINRRVRQLAHAVLGLIALLSGKRIGPYMPQIAGPWYAGQHDTDRGVSRASADGIRDTFKTEEKIRNFPRLLGGPILEYSRDAILKETPQTLSDERTTSKEDSAATYNRVVSCSLSTLASLVEVLPEEDILKHADVYDELAINKRVWEFAASDDAAVRRALYRFLEACLGHTALRPRLDLPLVGTALIYKALRADQTSTAGDLLRLLLKLTAEKPTIWTSDYDGKKTPEKRLQHFVKHGSHLSGAAAWSAIAELFKVIPAEALPSERAAIGELLAAVLAGLNRREERPYLESAWLAYLNIAQTMLLRASPDDRVLLLQERIVPVFSQYIDPTPAAAQWSTPAQAASRILSKALMIDGASSALATEWSAWTSKLVKDIRESQPQQSKNFEQSQEQVEAFGRQWVNLQAIILECTAATNADLVYFVNAQRQFLHLEARASLILRMGKPYGAAAILQRITSQLRSHLSEDEVELFVALLDTHTELLLSPSQSYYIDMIYELDDHTDFDRIWTKNADLLASVPDEEHLKALEAFLSTAKGKQAVDRARRHQGIQTVLQQSFDLGSAAFQDNTISTTLLACLSDESRQMVLSNALQSLSISDKTLPALETLEAIDNVNSSVLTDFVLTNDGRPLLSRIIALEASSDSEAAIKASALHQRLTGGKDTAQTQTFSLDLLRAELSSASRDSVPLDNVLSMARVAMKSSSDELASLLRKLMPIWIAALDIANSTALDSSLALMSALGNAVHLVTAEESTTIASFDAQGLSPAVRIGHFACTVLGNANMEVKVEDVELLSLLMRTARLVDDELSIVVRQPALITSPSPLAFDLVSFARRTVKDRLVQLELSNPIMDGLLKDLLAKADKTTVSAYAYAAAFVELVEAWTEAHGVPKQLVDFLEESIKSRKRSGGVLALAALAKTLAPKTSTSTVMQRYCSELIADLTGEQPDGDKVGAQLAILNVVLRNAEDLEDVIAKQRAVFYMKHVLEWLTEETTATMIKIGVYDSLQHILPLISDIYGEHFGTILESMKTVWTSLAAGTAQADAINGERLGLLHSTLRLYNTLTSLSKNDDPNEDLVDALKEHQESMMTAALHIFLLPQPVEETSHIPVSIVNRLLSRLVKQISTIPPAAALELYLLLDSKSSSVQETAFALLQRYTEQNQEQLSYDVALDKKKVHLPDELLSFLFSVPDIETVMSAPFETQMPEDLQSYLYSWLLVFSHFNKATLKVKEDYVEDIKAGEHLIPLLNLIYEFLGHMNGQPVDVSKYNITEYKRDQEEDPERDAEWLLAHVYYLCLLYFPALTKTHYLSITSRAASTSISKWIAKHYSPLIVSAAMTSVSEWTHTFASDPEYEKFSVTVRPRAQEISASYLVDDQTMTILVRLPDAYPLDGARVESISRVAVDARKWQSWLRNCQGVIQFSNGDVVDGLISWRRNVMGALKGQTECYICYSVVSADRQLPSKRCATCKNVFHSACLFKWFKTSNASSCPLCRTAFNYS